MCNKELAIKNHIIFLAIPLAAPTEIHEARPMLLEICRNILVLEALLIYLPGI